MFFWGEIATTLIAEELVLRLRLAKSRAHPSNVHVHVSHHRTQICDKFVSWTVPVSFISVSVVISLYLIMFWNSMSESDVCQLFLIYFTTGNYFNQNSEEFENFDNLNEIEHFSLNKTLFDSILTFERQLLFYKIRTKACLNPKTSSFKLVWWFL